MLDKNIDKVKNKVINLLKKKYKSLEIKSVTKQVKFLSPYTLSFAYIKGKPLKQCKNIKRDFFITLEKNVREMHEREIVHFDLRN